MFFEENAKLLEAFAKVSGVAGARADYVQGGGGNTSVKLGGGLMAIKASGFCLSDITPNSAYAVLDGAAIRDFYLTSEPAQFENVETAGSNKAKESVKTIEGLQQLRPSVEAGFHSILKTFVVHTHSVYANLAACAVNCKGKWNFSAGKKIRFGRKRRGAYSQERRGRQNCGSVSSDKISPLTCVRGKS